MYNGTTWFAGGWIQGHGRAGTENWLESYTWIFNCVGVRVLFLHTVPESTVYAFSLRLGTSTFHPSPSALYWKPTKCNKTRKAHKRYLDRRGRNKTFFVHRWHTVYVVVVIVQSPVKSNPMDCSVPGLPVPHLILEFAQIHVCCISDAIQPSHPLMSSFSSALNLSEHQGLFQWVICLHQMTTMLELQL